MKVSLKNPKQEALCGIPLGLGKAWDQVPHSRHFLDVLDGLSLGEGCPEQAGSGGCCRGIWWVDVGSLSSGLSPSSSYTQDMLPVLGDT